MQITRWLIHNYKDYSFTGSVVMILTSIFPSFPRCKAFKRGYQGNISNWF